MEKPTFGAVLQPQDVRDFPLAKLSTDVPEILIPEEYQSDISKIEIRHQHKQPACGAHAGAILEGGLSSLKGEPCNNSPRFLWKHIKDIDGYPIEVGTDMYSVLRVLKNVGVCDISLLPNDDEANFLSLKDYRTPSVTPEMASSATERRISSYATIYSPTFEQMKQAIYLSGAIIIQYRCGQNMYLPSWKARDIFPLSPDRYPMDSGHFVVGIGYDEKYIYFRNSWGMDWGEDGDGWFGEDYMKHVYAIGTAVDADKIDWRHTFTKTMSYGEKSTEVTALQRVLKTLGFFNQEPTGFYGSITSKAVMDFQVANNVASMAELNSLKGKRVGNKTIAKLNQVQYG